MSNNRLVWDAVFAALTPRPTAEPLVTNKKGMEVEIRSATMSDEHEIKELLKSTPGVWQEKWRDTAVAIAIESAGTLALVALQKDRIVGFASFHDVGFRAYLSEMVVSESEQGKATGSKLLRRAEELLTDKGCQLIVADAYPPAEGFYRKNGWKRPASVLMSKLIGEETG